MSNLSSTLGVDFQVKTIRVDDRWPNSSVDIERNLQNILQEYCHPALGYRGSGAVREILFLFSNFFHLGHLFRFRSVTKTYFRRADGVMLLYDVTSERSFTSVRHWVQCIDVSYSMINIKILHSFCRTCQRREFQSFCVEIRWTYFVNIDKS